MNKLLFCALLSFGSIQPAAPASLKAHALSEQDIVSIRALASSHPCAMLTLLHIMLGADTPEQGVTYIDEIPTPGVVNAVLGDLRAGSIDALVVAFQFNLYSDVPTFTELHWSSSQMKAGTWRLDFRAELKHRTGEPLTPRHILENPVEILVTPNGVRLPGSGSPGVEL